MSRTQRAKGTLLGDLRYPVSRIWLRLQETSGTTPVNAGTLGGLTLTWTPGAGALGQTGLLGTNEAYDFDGASAGSRISVATHAAIQGVHPQTIFILCKPDTAGHLDQGTLAMIPGEVVFRINAATMAILAQRVFSTTTAQATTTTALSTGNWNTVALRVIDDKTIQVFINGAEATYASAPTAGVGNVVSGSLGLFWGRQNDTNRTFDGLIDEAYWDNRAWADAEIRAKHRSYGLP